MHKLIFLITRTPLHISASTTDGPVDQPILRERHTSLPIIPGSTLKGVFAQEWIDPTSGVRLEDGVRLFGNNQPGKTTPAAIQFTEAKLLAFPIRSARDSFVWITSPLVLRRFTRDGGMPENLLPVLPLRDDQALFHRTGPVALTLGPETKVVLEDCTFGHAGDLPLANANPPAPPHAVSPSHSLGEHFRGLLGSDPVWQEVAQRLVIVNDGILSSFTRLACELVQHMTVDNQVGATTPGSIYSQENVPVETLFYATAHCLRRGPTNPPASESAELEAVAARLHRRVFQFGSDASTGLGLCTVEIKSAT